MSQVSISDFYCLSCFTKVPLSRKKSRMREKEHLKNIYCYKCNKEINHFEVREFDRDFNLEELKRRVRAGEFEGLDGGPKEKKGGSIFELGGII